VQTARQTAHWVLAASRLDLDELASHEAWGRLERYLGMSLRRHLTGVIIGSMHRAACSWRWTARQERPGARRSAPPAARIRAPVLRTERTLEFFADAINCRTNPQVAALLRACDRWPSQHGAAARRDRQDAPPAVTYLGEGRGRRS